MMKRILLSLLFINSVCFSNAADTTAVNPRPLTMEEYEKAKTFTINDLDKDTYAKFNNTYILDRYELRKPYIITGDDGLKKRIDLYKLVAKDGMQELGTMIFYTNEAGKRYTALQPNFTSDGKVWEKYFEDIHQVDKEEKNFVLKLSYVLSKEMSFQLYKVLNNGKDMKEESATYGSNICFPGDQKVAMFDGTTKQLSSIKTGDKVITIDPLTKQKSSVEVTQLVQHDAMNYAITQLLLIAAHEQVTTEGTEIKLRLKLIQATPNHPMFTAGENKKIGHIKIGDDILCLDETTNAYQSYKVFNKTEFAGGLQKVYNMKVTGGSTFVVNDVMVLQK